MSSPAVYITVHSNRSARASARAPGLPWQNACTPISKPLPVPHQRARKPLARNARRQRRHRLARNPPGSPPAAALRQPCRDPGLPATGSPAVQAPTPLYRRTPRCSPPNADGSAPRPSVMRGEPASAGISPLATSLSSDTDSATSTNFERSRPTQRRKRQRHSSSTSSSTVSTDSSESSYARRGRHRHRRCSEKRDRKSHRTPSSSSDS